MTDSREILLPSKTIVWGACMYLCYGPAKRTFDPNTGRVHLHYGPHYAGFLYFGG